MASHGALLDRMARSIAGKKVTPMNIPGGSLNYKFMDEFTIWNSSPTDTNRNNLAKLFRDMVEYGHFTIKGRAGYACELGCVGAHWGFSLDAWLGTMIWAARRNDKELFQLAKSAVMSEAIICASFNYKSRVCMPGARVKDEKGQTALDENKDRFLALSIGQNVKKGPKYWSNIQNLPIKLFRDCIKSKLFTIDDMATVRDRARFNDLPKLPFPINRRNLDSSGGGYLAWIDKTEHTTKLLGRDGLTWVLTGPQAGWTEFRMGYDWCELPEVE